MRLRIGTLLLALAVAVSVAGCDMGGDDPSIDAQPSPEVTTFEPGLFDALPRYPRSEPISERTEEDGVISQSFAARDTAPGQVLQYYRERLADWDLVDQPQDIGEGTYRGIWARESWTLTISATPGETVDPETLEPVGEAAEGVPVAQYNLTLAPRAG